MNTVDPLSRSGGWDRADALIESSLELDPPAVFPHYLKRAKCGRRSGAATHGRARQFDLLLVVGLWSWRVRRSDPRRVRAGPRRPEARARRVHRRVGADPAAHRPPASLTGWRSRSPAPPPMWSPGSARWHATPRAPRRGERCARWWPATVAVVSIWTAVVDAALSGEAARHRCRRLAGRPRCGRRAGGLLSLQARRRPGLARAQLLSGDRPGAPRPSTTFAVRGGRRRPDRRLGGRLASRGGLTAMSPTPHQTTAASPPVSSRCSSSSPRAQQRSIAERLYISRKTVTCTFRRSCASSARRAGPSGRLAAWRRTSLAEFRPRRRRPRTRPTPHGPRSQATCDERRDDDHDEGDDAAGQDRQCDPFAASAADGCSGSRLPAAASPVAYSATKMAIPAAPATCCRVATVALPYEYSLGGSEPSDVLKSGVNRNASPRHMMVYATKRTTQEDPSPSPDRHDPQCRRDRDGSGDDERAGPEAVEEAPDRRPEQTHDEPARDQHGADREGPRARGCTARTAAAR